MSRLPRLPVSDSNKQYVENGHLTLITRTQPQQWVLVNPDPWLKSIKVMLFARL